GPRLAVHPPVHRANIRTIPGPGRLPRIAIRNALRAAGLTREELRQVALWYVARVEPDGRDGVTGD
ncbi:hypothetical protein RZS08_05075, partial [Arthrospira platensis SPKY1]|nr:hypothetical protein [Arthrospira platensis SPKY1]